MATARQQYTGLKSFIRIEGGAVLFGQESIRKAVKLEDFVVELQKKADILTPVLPKGCRLYSKFINKHLFVLEQEPQMRRIIWDRGELENKTVFDLAFPYVIFVLEFNHMGNTVSSRVFYRTLPLGTSTDILLRSNLCNVGDDSLICTGNVRATGDSIPAKAASFTHNFWNSEFNRDLESNQFLPAKRAIPQVTSLTEWEKQSKENPLFVLQASWLPHGNLSTVLDQIKRGKVTSPQQ